jgi:hypothetical protein
MASASPDNIFWELARAMPTFPKDRRQGSIMETSLVREVRRSSAKSSANAASFRQPQRDVPGRHNSAELR